MARYLADTSAWFWSGRVAARWETLLEDDAIATCTPIALELLFSARGRDDYRALASDLSALTWLELDARIDSLAQEAQSMLAEQSQHRGATPIDILVAAAAAANDVTLLHYDRHFDAIGRLTGQPMEWLARRGTLR